MSIAFDSSLTDDRHARRRRRREEQADLRAHGLAPSRPAPCGAAPPGRCPPRAPRRCPPAPSPAPCPATSRRRPAPRPPASPQSPGSASARSSRRAGARAGRGRRWRGGAPAGCRRGTRCRGRSAWRRAGTGSTKVAKRVVASPGAACRPRSLVSTRSGVPSCQPLGEAGGAGRLSPGSPSGAPCDAHAVNEWRSRRRAAGARSRTRRGRARAATAACAAAGTALAIALARARDARRSRAR